MSEARILALRPRALGDLVLITPALRALKKAWPHAELDVVVETRYGETFEGHPHVDRVWPLERSTAATLGLARRLRARGYRIAVDFFGNPRSAALTRLSGAALRVGFALRGRSYAYHRGVPRHVPPAWGEREYAAMAHLRLAAAAGAPSDDWRPEIRVSDAARERAAGWFRRWGIAGRVIGLVAAGSWPTKTWPAGFAALLARGLLARGQVLLLAGPGEEDLDRRLVALVPGLRVLPRCGVQDLAATIERLDLVVGTDAGPKHLAVALGVPTFTWFGPTHPDTWSPPDPRHRVWRTTLPCAACDLTRCSHWSCLPGLSPQRALEQVEEHWNGHERAPAGFGPAHHA